MYDSIQYSQLAFHRDDWGQLVVTFPDGTTFKGVEAIRCFPHSDPIHAIAIVDELGHEVLNIPSIELLSPDSKTIVASELAERDFVPVIERIVSSSPPHPPCILDVQTDRGRTQFQLESEDDCRRLGERAVLIADSRGIRYSIPDIDQLDSASQRIVRRLV